MLKKSNNKKYEVERTTFCVKMNKINWKRLVRVKQVNVESQIKHRRREEMLVLTCREEQTHPRVILMHVSPSATEPARLHC